MLYSRVGTGAPVRTVHLAAPTADEDQASAGAQSALTALLPSWKAAVPLPLSRSMPGSSRGGAGVSLCATSAGVRTRCAKRRRAQLRLLHWDVVPATPLDKVGPAARPLD